MSRLEKPPLSRNAPAVPSNGVPEQSGTITKSPDGEGAAGSPSHDLRARGQSWRPRRGHSLRWAHETIANNSHSADGGNLRHAAAAKLRRLHERFRPCFGRHEPQEHSLGYLRGLLLADTRKRIEPMALVFAEPSEPEIRQSNALAWQRFITVSPWEAQAVQQEIQAVFNEEFVPTASAWPIGTVGVIDGSGFVKHGPHSVGVQRQWCGRVGKKENCQVGVFLLGGTPSGTALLDRYARAQPTLTPRRDGSRPGHLPEDRASGRRTCRARGARASARRRR